MDQPLRNVIALRTRKITRSLFNRMPGRTHCVHVSVRVNAWLSAWLDGRGVPFSRSRGMQRGAFLLSSSYSPVSYLSILVHDPLPLLRMHTFLSNSQVTLTCFLCPSQPTRRYADIYVRCGVSLRAPFGCEKKKRRQAIEKKKKKRNIKYLCSLRFFFYKYNIIYRNAELVMTSIYK